MSSGPGRRELAIPRVIHRIWLGSDPLPASFERYGESWLEHHPGWELLLWTENDLAEVVRSDAAARARHHSERSDVLRYEVLRRFGGVYADTDVECLRSLEPLLHNVRAFAAYQRPGRVGTAVLGAVPHHPLFERAAAEVADRVGSGDYLEATSVGFLTGLVKQFPDVTVFGPEKFYPYSWKEPERADEDFPDAFAVHHWSMTWRADPHESVRSLRAELARSRWRITALKEKLREAERRRSEAERRVEQTEESAARLKITPWRFLRR